MSEIAVRDNHPEPMMTIIERMALDPNVSVEKVERLVALHERMLAQNAKAEFAAAFVQMKPKLPRIIRTKRNPETGSMYAPLEDISAQVDPILYEHQFATTDKVVQQTDKSVTVRCELWHASGHVEFTDITMPLDAAGIRGSVNKTPVHATASAITYAKRYAKCAVLDIATSEDHDGSKPPRGYSRFNKSADGPQIAAGAKAGPPHDAAPVVSAPVSSAHPTGPDRATQLEQAGWDKTRDGIASLEDWWNALPERDQNVVRTKKGLLRQLHEEACRIEDDKRREEDETLERNYAERDAGYDASWNAHSDRESTG